MRNLFGHDEHDERYTHRLELTHEGRVYVVQLNLTNLERGIAKIMSQLDDLNARLDALSTAVDEETTALQAALDEVRNQNPEVDLSAVEARVDALTSRITAAVPAPVSTDPNAPVDGATDPTLPPVGSNTSPDQDAATAALADEGASEGQTAADAADNASDTPAA